MDSFFSQVFSLFTTPPGNLAYYVVLAFTVVGALQSSINHWRQTGFPQGNRMVSGLALLLILQLLQFAVAGLAWQGVLEPNKWLPQVDRMVVLVSLIVIVWLWLVPERAGLADASFSLAFILALVWFGFSEFWWREHTEALFYNATLPDQAANWFAMVLLVFGVIGLLARRPNSWGIGLAMFLLLFMGQFLQYFSPQVESNYSGAVRLAQLMAFPWLLALPQRFPIPTSVSAERPAVKPPQ